MDCLSIEKRKKSLSILEGVVLYLSQLDFKGQHTECVSPHANTS